mgnify:CR=1 FL=1
MNMRTQQIMQEFYTLHPDLTFLEAELSKALRLLLDTFRSGGKLEAAALTVNTLLGSS